MRKTRITGSDPGRKPEGAPTLNRIWRMAAAALLLPSAMFGAAAISAPDVAVGRNLQMAASIRLAERAGAEGLSLTLRSEDPKRLLLSTHPEKAGASEITIMVRPRNVTSAEFWVQGLADQGSAGYTVNAAGLDSVRASVTFAPSAVVILGPFRLPSFSTTPRSTPNRITLSSAMLNSSLKIAEEQQVAGGMAFDVTIDNPNPEAGTLGEPKLRLSAGVSEAYTSFKPAGIGSSRIAPAQPPGFTVPAEYGSVIAMVEKPGIAISDALIVGRDLQTLGVLCLGETPPPEGLDVTLTSSDGKKLLLSPKEDELGSATLTFHLKPGQLTAQYYLQAMGDSGTADYWVNAPGYRTRVARIGLAPSGLIVAYERYGPPDEASVLRKGGSDEERRFFVSLREAKDHPVHLVVYAAYLDPETKFAADITVQQLRPGISLPVVLTSSNPQVGAVESPLNIATGNNRVLSRFQPAGLGETVISIATPTGFSKPRNATKVPATVLE